MATLQPGVPITQANALLKVENRLDPGRHQFRLEVVDDAGLVSDPAFLVVTVMPPPPPPPGPIRRGPIDPRILTTVTRTPVTPIIRKPPIR